MKKIFIIGCAVFGLILVSKIFGGDSNMDSYTEGSVICEESQHFQHAHNDGICPVCNGSGLTVYFDGSIINCWSCGGSGRVDIEAMQRMFDGTRQDMQNNGSGDYSYSGSNSNENRIAELEHQLETKRKQLDIMEDCLQHLHEGGVNYAYQSMQVVSLRCEVEQLERQINSLQYSY